MSIILETDRLIARQFELADAPAHFHNFKDPAVWRWLGGGSAYTTVEEAEAALARQIERDTTPTTCGQWGVVVRDTNQLVGMVLLMPLEETTEIEVGYMLGTHAWGNGYGTEICRGMIDYGFRRLDVDHLCGVVFPENIASQRVLEKSGMTYRGMRHTFGFDMRYYTIERPHRDELVGSGNHS